MKRFKNSFDMQDNPAKGEINVGPSVTVPDMTMSLGELLARYTRGGEVATFQPVYQGHDNFDENPEFDKMDAVEKLQYASSIKEEIRKYRKRLQEVEANRVEKEPDTVPLVEPDKSEKSDSPKSDSAKP